MAASTTTLVSRATGAGGERGDSSSFQPSMSADARLVAYESTADNLSSEENEDVSDIFAHDLGTNTTTLVSRASGPGGAGGNGASNSPMVSGNGRFVAFLSDASNLSAADTNAARDVFVRDLATDLTILASHATGVNGPVGDGASGPTAISAEGRYVLFTSGADNLSAEDDNAVNNVFVRDLVANTTTLVSRATGPAGAGGNGGSGFGNISADGRRVAFESDADNLSGVDVNGVSNVFVRSLPPPAALPGPPGAGGPSPTGAGGSRITARCAGVRATIVGTNKRNVIRGTAKRDVIAALGGNDLVRGLGGDDLICLGADNDRGIGGAGKDVCRVELRSAC